MLSTSATRKFYLIYFRYLGVYLSTLFLVKFTLLRIVELLFNDELELGDGSGCGLTGRNIQTFVWYNYK